MEIREGSKQYVREGKAGAKGDGQRFKKEEEGEIGGEGLKKRQRRKE
jgi:hypothetical protein